MIHVAAVEFEDHVGADRLTVVEDNSGRMPFREVDPRDPIIRPDVVPPNLVLWAKRDKAAFASTLEAFEEVPEEGCIVSLVLTMVASKEAHVKVPALSA